MAFWWIVLCLSCPIIFWIRLMLKKQDSRSQLGPSKSFVQHAEGRWIWFVVFFATLLALLGSILASRGKGDLVSVVVAFVLSWFGCLYLIFREWKRVGKISDISGDIIVVPAGLIANFIIYGGLLSILSSLVINTQLMLGWIDLDPSCNLMNMEPDIKCHVLAALQWILTPGLVEETFKAIWLFLRLHRSANELPDRCFFGLLPASGNRDCGCWFKLAPTTAHVVLCALGCGAGFGCLENLFYVFCKTGTVQFEPMCIADPNMPDMPPVILALTRVLVSMLHCMWTALVGFGLARRMFAPTEEQPYIISTVLPPMLLHGLYDYAIFGLRNVSEKTPEDTTALGLLGLLFWFCLIATIVMYCRAMSRLAREQQHSQDQRHDEIELPSTA